MDGVSAEGGTLSPGGSDTAIPGREGNTLRRSQSKTVRDRHYFVGAPASPSLANHLIRVSDYPRPSYIVTETPTPSG